MERDIHGIITGVRLFKGIEHEGPRRSMSTLFVASPDVTYDEVLKHTTGHIYFGAGRLTPINEDVVRRVLRESFDLVTVEYGSLEQAVSFLKASRNFDMHRLLVVFTCRMVLSDGRVHTATVSAEEKASLMLAYPNLGWKTDDGESVTVELVYASYTNSLKDAYGADIIIN